ncbi:threonine--tRNA ligase [Thermotoga neapolitana]|uniref:Threonine--tRNA ligase n=1 Tax=Thermotoga neapolitana (strain ATCC 49049 / DSM 4359 / NBRC 107923 / NS-E) TaxID=309803 RepID=SYT_THENN|nr:threonine--tRNA ligase [Thermotoga neapolitana]B9KAN7.1 RecName: Full=Threonine--tRNA ligase; AltName: Full=Threonyl-tRNA synthetase; Short=ThrRS [Thermotoga neapolitana DSM 4359]ACM24020.1 Threonyl-tRNA synthetase [Thermotoga neapolitana DSM 4359]KFZ20813.1 threonyl-tRNA ligase [Thermotoga neapolitana LA10]HBF10934.1 threonine--tRNA ligase [Thermotoga neapolitana]
MKIKVVLPDGSEREYEKGTKPMEIAREVGIKKVIGAVVDEELWDLKRPLERDCRIRFVTLEDPEAPEFYRHTMAHILAQAVMRLYGKENVKLGIGPTIENGFYYDFDIRNGKLTEEDLPRIEQEMKKIIKENLPIEREEISKDEAKEIFKDQPYKLELIEEIEGDTVTIYRQGEFVDLCRGPHLPSTGVVKHFKLLSVSGAYWRGSEKNPMLTRVYGTAFAKKEDLENYLKFLEEAQKRDHRKLGPQLELFMLNTDYAPGMPFFLPRGVIVLNELMNFSRELHRERGYQEIFTPLIMNEQLWRISGHWDHYAENMYFIEKGEERYAVKPMNCPGHILVYKSRAVSYRDLPLRFFEFGRVHRYERSGVLHGLMRVRSFTQDDAHIFCTPDQIEDEILGVLELINTIYSQFGFTYRVELSTMPEDHMGDEAIWEKATNALKKALDRAGLPYRVNEGEGAFYGPKIDFHIKDSLGREWQCATIQLDFMMPEKFNVTYIGPDNREHTAVMIHRAIYGSLERFFGILIEHFAGAFPTWIAPVQVAVIPISDKHSEGAKKVATMLSREGFRVFLDDRRETLGYRIRQAQIQKIPYMVVLGDRELESGKLSVRTRSGKEIKDVEMDHFIDTLKKEVRDRKLELTLEG